MLKHVRRVREAIGIGDQSFSYVGEGIPAIRRVRVEMFFENAVASEHTEDPLEIIGVATGWNHACEDLRGGERKIGTSLPDSVGDVEADDGIEGHRNADHVCEL